MFFAIPHKSGITVQEISPPPGIRKSQKSASLIGLMPLHLYLMLVLIIYIDILTYNKLRQNLANETKLG